MNIEAYNLDSLRRLVRSLQDENKKLKAQLNKANIAYESEHVFDEKIENAEEYDPDQGGRILSKYITEDMVNKYFAMFWGRTDVYAKRGTKGGYFPQCNNRWNARICPKQRGEKINCEACGHTELGIYPLLADGTCRFLVFDFDNHEKVPKVRILPILMMNGMMKWML